MLSKSKGGLFLFFWVVAVPPLSPLTLGQIVTGSFTGTVSDETGAVIPGVTITVINENTGGSRQVITNDYGNYVVPDIQPGRYMVNAELAGFKKSEVRGIELHVEQTARVDFTLSIGEVTETVTVEAAALLLQSESVELDQVIEEKQVLDLPLNGRSYIQLATVTSGAVPQSSKPGQGASLMGGQSQRDNLTASISGQRETNVAFLLDGMDTRNVWANMPGVVASVDAIKEFKVQKNLFSAQHTSAAVISASVKSGTNEFHGGLFEFHRNDDLDAREFFDREAPPEFKLNQFGGSIGGPIIKNRTFFFFNYEGLRRRRANTRIATVPPPELLSGDFSSFELPVSDPLSVDEDGNKTPFPGNRIPAERISQVTRNFNPFIPPPNQAGGPRDNLIITPSNRRDVNQYHLRIDHKIGEQDNLFGRWSFYDDDIFNPGIAEFYGRIIPLEGQNLVIQESHSFGPNLLNVFKFSFNDNNFFNTVEPSDGRNFLEELGLRGIEQRPEDRTLPSFSISGWSGLGNTRGRGGDQQKFAFEDAVTWTRGNHTLNVGFNFSFSDFFELQNTNNQGVLQYDGRYTSLPSQFGSLSPLQRSIYALADYIVGNPRRVAFAPNPVVADWDFRNYAVYIQDNWKVHPRLTLNLGLRWNYETPWVEEQDQIGIFSPEIGKIIYGRTPQLFEQRGVPPTLQGLVVPDPAARRSMLDSDWNNFAPRIGLAIRATDDFVVRTGYGVYYITAVGKEHEFLMKTPPHVTNTAITGNPGRLQPNIFQDGLFPDPLSPEVRLTGVTAPFSQFQRDKTGYVQQWNLSLQRRLSSDLIMEAAYVGSAGKKLYTRWNQNQAPPSPDPVGPRRPWKDFANILTSARAASSIYHSGQFRLQKNFSRGFSFLAAYTVSKEIDDYSGGTGGSYHQDTNNRRAERAPGDIDIRNRLVISYLWELPFGEALNGFARHLLHGWQFNGIASFQSGTPITINQPAGFMNTGGRLFARPDRTADGRLDVPSVNRWFDRDAFEVVRFRFGNSARNIIYGPGFQNFDLSLFKNNYIGEDVNVQFRVEFFNAFNHPNFNHPNGNAASINFGTIRSALDAREIQFGLKLIF